MKLSAFFVMLSFIVSCKKSQDCQNKQVRTQSKADYYDADYLELEAARSITDDSVNYLKNIKLSSTFIDYLGTRSHRVTGQYTYEASSNSTYYLRFDGVSINNYRVKENKAGSITILINTGNIGSFFYASSDYDAYAYKKTEGEDITIKFKYGDATETLPVANVIQALNHLIDYINEGEQKYSFVN